MELYVNQLRSTMLKNRQAILSFSIVIVLAILSNFTHFNPLRGAIPRVINPADANSEFPQGAAVERLFKVGKSIKWGFFQEDVDMKKGKTFTLFNSYFAPYTSGSNFCIT